MGGKILLIGVGIDYQDITMRALKALQSCDFIMGHQKFYNQLKDQIHVIYVPEDDIRDSHDIEELNLKRIKKAVSLAEKGNTVGLLSGGDPGIWASAGYFTKALDLLNEKNVDLEVLPGVPAFMKANAYFGAPLNFGFSLLPLCDEWLAEDEVFSKVESSLKTDQVVVLYKLVFEAISSPFYPPEKYPFIHPPHEKSLSRLRKLQNLLLKYRSKDTPVGIYAENPLLLPLRDLPHVFESLTYFALLIVGNSLTILKNGKMVTTKFDYAASTV
ncbi:MAG: hypothetical protein HXS44_15860 [Theionarchaea archaeon]|nr:hypothetical protein [Theionarchaea archaeon]